MHADPQQILDRQRDAIAAAHVALGGPAEGVVSGALEMIASFARMMLRPESAQWACFISREQQEPTAAFEYLFDNMMSAIFSPFAGLVRRARSDLSEMEARATALLLIGQVLSLRTCRATVCRVLGQNGIDAVGEALLMDRLAANVRCILTRESP